MAGVLLTLKFKAFSNYLANNYPNQYNEFKQNILCGKKFKNICNEKSTESTNINKKNNSRDLKRKKSKFNKTEQLSLKEQKNRKYLKTLIKENQTSKSIATIKNKIKNNMKLERKDNSIQNFTYEDMINLNLIKGAGEQYTIKNKLMDD